jgi:hypothetical protein
VSCVEHQTVHGTQGVFATTKLGFASSVNFVPAAALGFIDKKLLGTLCTVKRVYVHLLACASAVRSLN